MNRWNAIAIVLRANKESSELGGHIASFQSAATLYDVGFTHFWHGPSGNHPGDLVFIQGHSSPGIYARAFLEGRLTEEQLDNFRQEAFLDGLPSYPHRSSSQTSGSSDGVHGPGPLMAIYRQDSSIPRRSRARIYRGPARVGVPRRRECDEPESLGAISLAGRSTWTT
jgi:pyruvate dehydrogenase E1 component